MVGLAASSPRDEAETYLIRAAALNRPGPYQWEAAIQSAHSGRDGSDRKRRGPCGRVRPPPEWIELPSSVIAWDGTYFDASGLGRWTASGPFEGGVKIRDIDDEEATELLFGIGEGTVLDVTLAPADA